MATMEIVSIGPNSIDIEFSVAVDNGVLVPTNYNISGDAVGSLTGSPDLVIPVSGNVYRLLWNDPDIKLSQLRSITRLASGTTTVTHYSSGDILGNTSIDDINPKLIEYARICGSVSLPEAVSDEAATVSRDLAIELAVNEVPLSVAVNIDPWLPANGEITDNQATPVESEMNAEIARIVAIVTNLKAIFDAGTQVVPITAVFLNDTSFDSFKSQAATYRNTLYAAIKAVLTSATIEYKHFGAVELSEYAGGIWASTSRFLNTEYSDCWGAPLKYPDILYLQEQIYARTDAARRAQSGAPAYTTPWVSLGAGYGLSDTVYNVTGTEDTLTQVYGPLKYYYANDLHLGRELNRFYGLAYYETNGRFAPWQKAKHVVFDPAGATDKSVANNWWRHFVSYCRGMNYSTYSTPLSLDDI